MLKRFSEPVLAKLRSAGWVEGRQVDPTAEMLQTSAVFPKAEEVLSEFSGLHIGKIGPGIDLATSDVTIDPNLVMFLLPELSKYEATMGMKLFPLGEVHVGHGYLVIDERGGTYLLSDKLEAIAPSFPEALEMLLLGKKKPST